MKDSVSFNKRLYFHGTLSDLWQNWEGGTETFSIFPLMHSLSHYQHHSLEWYINKDGTTLILCNHPKFIVDVMFILSVVHYLGLDKCIMTYINHNNILQGIVTALKILCAQIHHSLPTVGNRGSFYFSIVLPFPKCHINGIIQYIDSWDASIM